jgi:uncharacterized protein DUF4255/carboxypeptidase family protein
VAVTIDVPLNTMLADLDESLRQLLRRQLGRHGFDGAEIAFEAPSKEWASQLSSPTLNLFLYDLRESRDHHPVDWEPRRENGRPLELRPPLRLEVSYAVTAWTREVEDEHRLLSQVLAVLYAFPELPQADLAGTLADQPIQRFPLYTRVAQPRSEGGPEFWSAVGGPYKASLDYCVVLSCEPGVALERGPEVRTQTLRMRQADAPRASLLETHRLGGTVRDADGEPVQGAWVVVADAGAWTATGPDGRFRFQRLSDGEYHVIARGPDGAEAEAVVQVPGGRLDLVVGPPAKQPARRRR